MNQKRILSIIGLAPDLQEQLKALLAVHLGEGIVWGNATDASIQGIIINAHLMKSPQIKTFVKRKQLNIVCCYMDPTNLYLADETPVPCLNLANYNEETFSSWLRALLGKRNTSNISTEASINSNAMSSARNEEPASQETKALSKDYTTLLNYIHKKTGYYVVSHRDNQTWVNPKKNEVYLEYETKKIPAIDTIGWREITSMDFKPPNGAKKLRLDAWLFESLWLSSDSHLVKLPKQKYYKLARWPHPFSPNGRASALRLSAFIINKPMTITQLSSTSGYDTVTVERFLFAALKSQYLSQSTAANVRNIEKTAEKKAIDTAKLSLLKRLRHKLKL